MVNPFSIKIIECPRDAMQGWPHFIPTEKKAQYINALLKVGFDTIDFGSFVSPKAIPQMRDTKEVLESLTLTGSKSRLLAIIANLRGASEALQFDEISYLGYPLSVSETFQQRNANSSIADSVKTVAQIQELCIKANRELVLYLSMAFGNPYGDAYTEDLVLSMVDEMKSMGIQILSIADTVGLATPEQVSAALKKIIPAVPGIEIGVHLHSAPSTRIDKLDAALSSGCHRFDSAIMGIGGCPMAGDELVGNMDTKVLIDHFTACGFDLKLDLVQLDYCHKLAQEIFI